MNAIRASTYLELQRIAQEKGHGRAWADAFFRAEESAHATSAEPPAAPPPAPTPSA